jgi:hypothetical protein
METPERELTSSQYRIFVQNIEQHLARPSVNTVEAEWEFEQMFSLLNKRLPTGKYRARICKFLNSLSQFSQSLWRRFSQASYLIEGATLSGANFATVGHRIASPIPQPVRLEICFRKD